MRIGRVRVADFRNYAEREFEPADVTVLVGPNASGKTNLVEAVQVATSTRSFRNPEWADLVRWGADAARVEVEASGETSEVALRVDVEASGRRTFRVDGATKRRLSEVAGFVPSVVFTPDDLRLVKGPAERRRSALDEVGEQLYPAYGTARRDYAKAVRHRNALLREGAPSSETAPWTDRAADLGGRLMALRLRLLSRMAGPAERAYSELAAGEGLTVRYADRQGLEPDFWRSAPDAATCRAAILAALLSREAEERARRTTLAGPHRDDLAFEVDGHDVRAFGSQGQQRSVALAWKVAALRTLEEVTGRRPVLLLDDVMSELDETRRTALAGLVGAKTQTFITTTNLGYFRDDALAGAEVIELP